MIFFDILYNIIIYPIEFIIEILFYLFSVEFKSSYGVSLFLLSLCINFLSLPLYNIAESWQAKERAIQDKMKPMIDNIKAVYKGDQRYLLIRTCQRINGYKTIYAFRGTLGLLIQIPFFMAAYNFVHSLTGLSGQSFLFIKDLSKPDALIHIGNISINLLPFLMTLFSLLAGFVYSRKLKFKESLPLYVVSLIFLLLLYNSPSGLLFYWTINCLFSFIKNIIIEFKLYEIFVRNRYKLLKAYNIFFIIVTVLFVLLIVLSKIERKGYLSEFKPNSEDSINTKYIAKVMYYSNIFRSSDIFDLKINTNKLSKYIDNIEITGANTKFAIVELNKNIENIDENIEIIYSLSIKSYSINIYIILLLLFFIINIKIIYKFILKTEDIEYSFIKYRNKLIIVSCLVITILSGLFIITSLIYDSPKEFMQPYYLIINTLSISIGLFLFYPLFIYLLFSDKIKSYLTLIIIFISGIVLINTFIMTGNYVNIDADFIFDNTELLKASTNQIIFNIILILSVILLFTLSIVKKRLMFFINIYFIILLALFSVSVFNIRGIITEQLQLEKINVNNNIDDNKMFNLSKNGENIFVFILDRAVSSYWYDAINKYPEFKTKFDGFVFYKNNVSFCSTTLGIGSIYGGYDYLPYEMSTNGNYIIKEKHNESLLMIPLVLGNYGYKSSILDPAYANFSDIPDLSIFQNYSNISSYNDYHVEKNIESYKNREENSKLYLKKVSIRFSIFRMLPINLRYVFYDDKKWFNFNVNSFINSSIYYYTLLSYTKKLVKIHDDGNYYNILHNMATHFPSYFNVNYLPGISASKVNDDDLFLYKDDNSVRHYYVNIASMNVIVDFINYLKDNNLYDNTKIIVVSDHEFPLYGLNNYDINDDYKLTINLFNALLIYKDFNSRGELIIDTNFSTVADVPYLVTKHIHNIRNPFNNKIITNDYKTNGAYIIFSKEWQVGLQYSNMFSFRKFYHVKDNIFDTNNWKKFVTDLEDKDIVKEVEFIFDSY
ncbi:YidC/Oxa1 family membrane protein insertase [Brachyspira hyodysenteriae]|uniref:YidC/Oxa1 family membrane protein insertase n=2 Tax=Brachyspira hyodysenteriae TaxID=159 RepID=UPI001ADDB1D2|nr:YidC/Oxa1 family membrane protein insertase [Brachyspira hyodysenteriae]QTM04980.1 sulfatase-like hydrolase/transferase [Brachyspira hyodysenteriae]